MTLWRCALVLSLAVIAPRIDSGRGLQLTGSPTQSSGQGKDVVLVGAGDIGHCALEGAQATGKLLKTIPGTVFTLGDNAYTRGSYKNYLECYDPWWGPFKDRTRPVPGNHDYLTPGARGYFQYFGSRAGPTGRGYYTYTLGGWNIYALNSAVPADARSAQYRWLAAELASHPATCTLAYWHNPVTTSGINGDAIEMMPVWSLLHAHGADVVLSGHEHHYERFAPLDAELRPDAANGIREFVVGTGGGPHYVFGAIKPSSEEHFIAWGVLKLILKPTSYSWEFVPVSGESGRDSGEAPCH